MKMYKWEGKGVYLGATMIVCAEYEIDAKLLIEKELIDNSLGESWKETEELEVIEISNDKVIYFDNGDY